MFTDTNKRMHTKKNRRIGQDTLSMLSDCFTIIRLEPGAELLDACSEIHETYFSIISIKLTHICMGDAHVSYRKRLL